MVKEQLNSLLGLVLMVKILLSLSGLSGLFGGALLLSLLITTHAFADEIYVVNLQKIISTSIAGKAAKNDFESEVKKSDQKLRVRKEEVTRLQTELSKQASLLSDRAKEEKSGQLQKKQGDLELALADERDTLRSKYDSSLRKLVESIQKKVASISESRKIGIVMDREENSVLYVNPAYDLTDSVIKELDKGSM